MTKPSDRENVATGPADRDDAQTTQSNTSARVRSFSRRALLEAGWTVPLIAAVQFPTDAFAVSVPMHNDSTGLPHGDNGGLHGDEILFVDLV